MEFSFMTQVNASKEKVWENYANIQNWYKWEEDLRNITLNDEFKTGTTGVMELEGMPPMEYVLSEVKEFQAFWGQTDTPIGTVAFGYEIIEHADHMVSVKHTVRLVSDACGERELGFLKQIFDDVPSSILLLKNVIEAL